MVNTKTKIESIKDVALLLRKSRGLEEDLEKHKQDLIELCINNNWRYTIYEELGTSTEIEYRPEMQKLLDDINDDLYDGVLVVDKDRLSRESTGQALINKTLMDNDCLIITPNKIYDLNNESDILMSEVEDLFARIEYRAISKRFRRGKRRGAKMGNWVNGTPPFPYRYNAETKGLDVDEEKTKWYRFMIDQFFAGKPFYEIAWELNRMGIKTQKGGNWHENGVRRILLSEVHLGRIIYNKSEGSGHKNKKAKKLIFKPREEWFIKENCHKALKTQDEHDKILATLSSRRKVPKTSVQIKLPLAGLLKCGKCNKSLSVGRRKYKNEFKFIVRTCHSTDFIGNKCGNSAGDAWIIMDFLSKRLKNKIDEIEKNIKEGERFIVDTSNYQIKIDAAQNQINKKEKAIERAYFAYEEGEQSFEKYKERADILRREIKKLEDQIKSYELFVNESNSIDDKEKLEKYKKVYTLLSNLDNVNDEDKCKNLNENLKDVIYEIQWVKQGNDISIDVIFQ
ncbi:MAG: recombinase family protein [Bacillaceae bacterium]